MGSRGPTSVGARASGSDGQGLGEDAHQRPNRSGAQTGAQTGARAGHGAVLHIQLDDIELEHLGAERSSCPSSVRHVQLKPVDRPTLEPGI